MITLDSFKNFLKDRNFILLLSLFLGLSLNQLAQWTEKILIIILIFIMTISMTNISKEIFFDYKRWVKPMLTSIILNYLILGGSIIILSYFLKLPHQYLLGFIILASVPPAVAVIPFTNFLGGNLDYSIVGFLSSYIGAFIFTPFILSLFLGSIPSFQSKLYLLLIELIIIPFILSRILIYFNIEERIVNYKGTFINWSFFIIIYTIVGLNNEVFLRNPFSLGSLIIISFLTTFLLGYFIELFFKKINFDSDKITSYILLGTSKNSGFAAGLALTLISVESTVPSTITTIFMLIFFIYLDIKRKYSL